MKRPSMEVLMRHIAAGGIKIVLIFKFERVLRSTDEWGPFRAFLKKHRCRLASPMENLSDNTPMARFNNNQRANLAEFERLNTAEKVREKLAAQAERGIWNCGLVPYGYTYDSQEKALSPHPVETAVRVIANSSMTHACPHRAASQARQQFTPSTGHGIPVSAGVWLGSV